MAYINGEQNIVTNCMSRPALAVQIEVCNLLKIVQAQTTEDKIKSYPNLKEYLVSKCSH